MTLDELYTIIKTRRSDQSKGSYVAKLIKKGNDRIIQKLGEESVELIIASKNKNKKEIIAETTDLLFHLLILLTKQKIKMKDLYEELDKRRK